MNKLDFLLNNCSVCSMNSIAVRERCAVKPESLLDGEHVNHINFKCARLGCSMNNSLRFQQATKRNKLAF